MYQFSDVKLWCLNRPRLLLVFFNAIFHTFCFPLLLQVTIEVLVSALSLWIYVVGHVLSALNCIFAGFISCDYLLISVSESPRYSCATMEQSEHKRRYDSIQSNCKPYVTWVLCQSHTNHENANPCMITKGVYTFSQNASRWYVRTTMPFGKWYTCYHFVGIRELHRGDATILNTRLLFSVRSQDSSRVVMTYHQTRFLACGPSAPCMVTGWVKILQSSDVFSNWIRNWVVYSLKRYVKFKLLYILVLKKYINYAMVICSSTEGLHCHSFPPVFLDGAKCFDSIWSPRIW